MASLHSLLKNISSSVLPEKEFNELIKNSLKISTAILSKRYYNYYPNFLNGDFSTTDFAIDSISPLFIKDKLGELPIKKSLLTWDKEITDEASAYYFLSKVIGNRIEQEISKKLKEADPFFAKILRSINYVIEKKNYSKTSYFGVVYILENVSAELNQKPSSAEFIEALPNNFFHGSNEKILVAVFDYLKKETDLYPAVPLNALIRRIKRYHSDNFTNSLPPKQTNFDSNLDIENIVSCSLNDVTARLNTFYVEKGKLNKDESEIFRNVLVEYANDLKDGGVSRGLYDYFNAHMIDLSKEDFYEKYHHNLDYLIRLLKKGIAERLEIEK